MGGYGSGQVLSHRYYLENLRRISIQDVIATVGKLNCRYIEINDNEIIHILFSTCNYGGYRAWFKCPECGRRISVLYASMGRYACRKCWKLPYQSQSRGYINRLFDKVFKIESKIGGQHGDKPKGMHWKTYFRLWGTALNLREKALNIGLMAFLNRYQQVK